LFIVIAPLLCWVCFLSLSDCIAIGLDSLCPRRGRLGLVFRFSISEQFTNFTTYQEYPA
jgi:hypothetical protein